MYVATFQFLSDNKPSKKRLFSAMITIFMCVCSYQLLSIYIYIYIYIIWSYLSLWQCYILWKQLQFSYKLWLWTFKWMSRLIKTTSLSIINITTHILLLFLYLLYLTFYSVAMFNKNFFEFPWKEVFWMDFLYKENL